MGWKNSLAAAVLVLASVLAAQSAAAEIPPARKQDEQAIRATAKAYLAAAAKGDSKALAEFWTADGDFIDDQGNSHPASELIAEAKQGAQAESKITASEIRFLTADVAIEEGASESVSADAEESPPVRGHYHAVWVKQGGRWRLASLCEIPVPAATTEPSLSDLDWMVGTWTGEFRGEKMEVTVQWNATRTFLLRDSKMIHDGKVVLHSSQRIGWDPLTRKLKSWSFESDGSLSEATWTQEGDSWVGQATGVLADGRQSSCTTVITYIDNDHFTRQTLAGRVEGEPIPDMEVRFTRRADAKR